MIEAGSEIESHPVWILPTDTEIITAVFCIDSVVVHLIVENRLDMPFHNGRSIGTIETGPDFDKPVCMRFGGAGNFAIDLMVNAE